MSRTRRDRDRGISAKSSDDPSRDGSFSQPSKYKRDNRKARRAKVQDAIRHNEDPPSFKITDLYNWY